jgi:hypothetical protein
MRPLWISIGPLVLVAVDFLIALVCVMLRPLGDNPAVVAVTVGLVVVFAVMTLGYVGARIAWSQTNRVTVDGSQLIVHAVVRDRPLDLRQLRQLTITYVSRWPVLLIGDAKTQLRLILAPGRLTPLERGLLSATLATAAHPEAAAVAAFVRDGRR